MQAYLKSRSSVTVMG